jgi:hypothetical protein
VSWTHDCDLLFVLFAVAVACAFVGNALGVLAWRQRTEQQGRWQWLFDPTYLFRASYYKQPNQLARYIAILLLVTGSVCLVAAGSAVIAASQNGARGICGLAF